jgi:hypothetical protein
LDLLGGIKISTRSFIAVKNPEEEGYTAVYCHYDGYPSGVGAILKKYYKTISKVEKLISGGGISSLGKDIGTKHDFDSRTEGETTYYHRDRGESLQITEARTKDELIRKANDSWAEYLYIFDKSKWETIKI